jgi:hypothetical protein
MATMTLTQTNLVNEARILSCAKRAIAPLVAGETQIKLNEFGAMVTPLAYDAAKLYPYDPIAKKHSGRKIMKAGGLPAIVCKVFWTDLKKHANGDEYQAVSIKDVKIIAVNHFAYPDAPDGATVYLEDYVWNRNTQKSELRSLKMGVFGVDGTDISAKLGTQAFVSAADMAADEAAATVTDEQMGDVVIAEA